MLSTFYKGLKEDSESKENTEYYLLFIIAMLLPRLPLLRHLPPAAARNYQVSIDAKTRASKTAVTFGGHTANLVY